jgi:hypothetical protein
MALICMRIIRIDRAGGAGYRTLAGGYFDNWHI